MRRLLLLLCLGLLVACVNPGTRLESESRPTFAIAIHGGAGVVPEEIPPERLPGYEAALEKALRHGRDLLARGASALDTVEAVVAMLEDDPHFNAGKGAVFSAAGKNELDASIMDGATLACGAVASVTTVKNPIRLARRVMDETRHVLLAAEGAESFAREQGFSVTPPEWFHTDRRFEAWQRVHRRNEARRMKDRSTVGCVALDARGHLAAATSTGGLTDKRFGRVGDSPIIGAGTYADDATCAVSCTGTGEEFIRYGVARAVASRMALADDDLETAADFLIHRVLKPDDGGLIAVSRNGEIAIPFSTAGMYRGAADSSGRFEIGIGRGMFSPKR